MKLFFKKALASLMLFATMTASGVADAADRHIWLVNDTSLVIVRFYASNVDSMRWEEDILGSTVLLSGRRARIDIDDGTGQCYFDLKVVFNNGATVIRRSYNVCERSHWTIQD